MSKPIEDEINQTAVTKEDLLKAANAVHQLPPEHRDWEGRMFTMAKMFKGERYKGLAVEYRLVAMTRMLEANVLPGWAQPKSPDGSVSVAEPIWVAAASEPLIFETNEPFFDTEKFLAAVLNLAEPEGSA